MGGGVRVLSVAVSTDGTGLQCLRLLRGVGLPGFGVYDFSTLEGNMTRPSAGLGFRAYKV